MKFKWAQAFVRRAQKISLGILLWMTYLFGIGVTILFVLIFNRKFLAEENGDKDSFWREAKGYGRSDHDVMRQS